MWSIPACAGEPGIAPAAHSADPVYPRVCGGTYPASTSLCSTHGLSPRVRGNQRGHGYPGARVWSIPACAGEPRAIRTAVRAVRVYPRVCGGTDEGEFVTGCYNGLSPRVRGNLARECQCDARFRSIPACAGEPEGRNRGRVHRAVYPRVCGGTLPCAPMMMYSAGLSPRVRGNRSALIRPPRLGGSIPACAGEPCRAWTYPCQAMVYPRVCGGTPPPSPRRNTAQGLSPRVRGNLRNFVALLAQARSIPACAGEPGLTSRRASPRWVYPRVCGGTGGALIPPTHTEVYPRVCGGTHHHPFLSDILQGLSPRVRGNR